MFERLLRACILLSFLAALVTLGGCGMVVLNPAGHVAGQQRDLLVATTILMLLIVVPVLVALGWIGWRYRESNQKAAYAPDWEHSTLLELLMWSVPLVIVIAIGAITWIGTHTLDPYHPLNGKYESEPLAADKPVLRVEVVSLNWKWLFFYPDYGIATVNELAAPLNVPIHFKLTSSDAMNSLYIPALAGQIYTMAGMQTKLHGIINTAGSYTGFSANYSGEGFTHMDFDFIAQPKPDFAGWVASVKAQGEELNRARYASLAEPSIDDPVQYFSSYAPGLYKAILNQCVDPSQMCMDEMMHIDAMGGRPSHETPAE